MRQKPEIFGFAFFVLMLLWNLSHHRLWGDELQAWSIVRTSNSLSELFQNLEYEGHPALWHLILYPLTRLTGDPVALKFVQGAFSSLALGLLWFRSPFKLPEKVLISSSYHFLFSYAVLARPYAIGIVLCMIFVDSRRRLDERPWLAWLLLGLMANVQFFFALMSVALAFLWLGRADNPKRLVRGFPIYLFLSGLAALCVLRAGALGESTFPWHLYYNSGRLTTTCSSFGNAFFPIGEMGRWESISPKLPPIAGFYLGLLLLLMLWKYLWPDKLAWLTFTGYCTVTLAFFYLRHGGESWHYGLFYIFFITTVWLSLERGNKLGSRGLLLLLLFLSVPGGIKAVVGSTIQPTSSNQAAAEWIEKKGLEKKFWIAYPTFPALAVSAYLDRPLYTLETGSEASFTRWEKQPPVNPEDLGPRIAQVCEREGLDEVHLIQRIDPAVGVEPEELTSHFKVTELARFEQSQREQYVLYKLEPVTI